MAQMSTYWFIFGPFTNLPFGICAIYFDLKVTALEAHFFPDGTRNGAWKMMFRISKRVYSLRFQPSVFGGVVGKKPLTTRWAPTSYKLVYNSFK